MAKALATRVSPTALNGGIVWWKSLIFRLQEAGKSPSRRRRDRHRPCPSVFNRVHTSRAVAPAAAEGPLEASDPARAPFLVPVSSGFSFVRQLPAQTRGRPRPGRPGYQNLLEAPRPPPESVPRPAGPNVLSPRDGLLRHARFRQRFGRFSPSCGRTRLAVHHVSRWNCRRHPLSDAVPLACLIARSISSR